MVFLSQRNRKKRLFISLLLVEAGTFFQNILKRVAIKKTLFFQYLKISRE